MKYNVYAIQDELAGFLGLTLDVTDDQAIRNFEFAINKEGTMYHDFAKNFSLYRLGSYDSESGEIVPKKELVIEATSLKRKKGK